MTLQHNTSHHTVYWVFLTNPRNKNLIRSPTWTKRKKFSVTKDMQQLTELLNSQGAPKETLLCSAEFLSSDETPLHVGSGRCLLLVAVR